MKYYHISNNSEDIVDVFIPRIPEDRAIDEDSNTKRVCVAKSIEDCLSAIPWGYDINYYIEEELPITVYELEPKDEDVMDSDYLYKNNLVCDSIITKECWITKEIKPSKIYDIILSDILTEIKTIKFKNEKTLNVTQYLNIDYFIDRNIL